MWCIPLRRNKGLNVLRVLVWIQWQQNGYLKNERFYRCYYLTQENRLKFLGVDLLFLFFYKCFLFLYRNIFWFAALISTFIHIYMRHVILQRNNGIEPLHYVIFSLQVPRVFFTIKINFIFFNLQNKNKPFIGFLLRLIRVRLVFVVVNTSFKSITPCSRQS